MFIQDSEPARKKALDFQLMLIKANNVPVIEKTNSNYEPNNQFQLSKLSLFNQRSSESKTISSEKKYNHRVT